MSSHPRPTVATNKGTQIKVELVELAVVLSQVTKEEFCSLQVRCIRSCRGLHMDEGHSREQRRKGHGLMRAGARPYVGGGRHAAQFHVCLPCFQVVTLDSSVPSLGGLVTRYTL